VHYDRNYVNAFWNGSVLTYGDGDGVISDALTTLDVVAHELSHGVTEFTAGLIYQNESGALNEATSDIFAAATEAKQTDATFESIWYVGRYMNDPKAAGDFDYYPTRYTGTDDNGGVHWNSGIANLFFHLLSEGGSHPRVGGGPTVAKIGIENAGKIWFKALDEGMTASTDFSAAREETVAAANALDGTGAWAQSVNDAWDAVGVPTPPNWQEVHITDNSTIGTITEGTYYRTTVTLGELERVRFNVLASTGDADLYVRFGSAPTTQTYDCASLSAGSMESCEPAAQAGEYHVMIHAWSNATNHPGDVTDATLTVDGVSSEPECVDASDCTGGDVCTASSACVEGACEYTADPACCTDGDQCDTDTRTCAVGVCDGTNTCGAIDDSACCLLDSECPDDVGGDPCIIPACDLDSGCGLADNPACNTPVGGSCSFDYECADDGDSCNDELCGAGGTCESVDNGTCTGGNTGDACSANSDCNSGKCRTKGKWAGTCT
jgi:hypothetical protein